MSNENKPMTAIEQARNVISEIETYAKLYHQEQLSLLASQDVSDEAIDARAFLESRIDDYNANVHPSAIIKLSHIEMTMLVNAMNDYAKKSINTSYDVSDEAIIDRVESMSVSEFENKTPQTIAVGAAMWMRSIMTAKLAEREKEYNDLNNYYTINSASNKMLLFLNEQKDRRIAELEAQLKQKGEQK